MIYVSSKARAKISTIIRTMMFSGNELGASVHNNEYRDLITSGCFGLDADAGECWFMRSHHPGIAKQFDKP